MSTEENKISILNAAIEAFSSKGYGGSSIREIALAANVNHAIIRYHYGSKEALWLSVIQHLLLETANLRKRVPFNVDAPDLKEELRKFVRSRVQHVAQHPQLLKIILLEIIDGGPRFAQIDMLMRRFFSETLNIVSVMHEAGVTRDFHAKDLFFVMPMLVGGRFLYSNADRDFDGNPIDIDEAIDAHTEIILTMIYAGA